mgnify:CR=1 FL=1
MTDINHQPCPHEACGSSDAFSWNTEKRVGCCCSCAQPYPSKKMHVFDWVAERYPLKGNQGPMVIEEDEGDYMDSSCASKLKVVEATKIAGTRAIK